jgi:molecular chaperone GrpE (heat shock protein)
MIKFFDAFFKRQPTQAADQTPLLVLESQLQGLKLELEEKKESLSKLNATLERLRLQGDASSQEKADARVEALLGQIAGPISQLITQADLVENQGKTIPAQDVILLVKKLIKGFQEQGLALSGNLGQIVPYNPDLHTPLSGNLTLQAGQPVKIRFVGIQHKQKTIKKALVDPAPEEQTDHAR